MLVAFFAVAKKISAKAAHPEVIVLTSIGKTQFGPNSYHKKHRISEVLGPLHQTRSQEVGELRLPKRGSGQWGPRVGTWRDTYNLGLVEPSALSNPKLRVW